VGAFPHYGGRWAEWNGDFRDSVRAFIKGSEGDFIGARRRLLQPATLLPAASAACLAPHHSHTRIAAVSRLAAPVAPPAAITLLIAALTLQVSSPQR